MKSPITVILPVCNCERTLKSTVYSVLEVAEAHGRRARVVAVDDGSTDDTFEAACELARMFPQVIVLRQPFPRGLGPALDMVRRKLGVERAIVHDGVSPLDVDVLSRLIADESGHPQIASASPMESRGSRRIAAAGAPNAKLAEAPRASTSLMWLALDEPLTPRRRRELAAESSVPAPIGMNISSPVMPSMPASFA